MLNVLIKLLQVLEAVLGIPLIVICFVQLLPLLIILRLTKEEKKQQKEEERREKERKRVEKEKEKERKRREEAHSKNKLKGIKQYKVHTLYCICVHYAESAWTHSASAYHSTCSVP